MDRLVGLFVAGALAVACGRVRADGANGGAAGESNGTSGSGGSSGSSAPGGSGATDLAGTPSVGGMASCSAPVPLARAGLRPLGQAELRNELAVFGESLANMTLPGRFSRIYQLDDQASREPPDLDSSFREKHAAFAAGLAERVTADAARLGALLGCDVERDAALCKKRLFDFVLDRLFRGLADEAILAQLEAMFAEGERASGDFLAGARAVLAAALQAPEFLYHVELGVPVNEGGVERRQLTDLELASRLSFLLWGTGPDAELLELARAGRLSEPSELSAAAQRMLNDPRSELGVARFYRELLGIDEGRRFDADSGVPPEVLGLMDREFSSFVWHATLDDGKGDAASLVEPISWINGELADYYGWSGVGGDAFQAVDLDPTRYAGVLTLPAWLTRASGPSATHPSVRGWWVARGLLCNSVPPEPEAVFQPPPPPNLTERQRLAQHTTPACAICHNVVDPPGLALEHFDAAGRYREDDDGLFIDTSNLSLPDGNSFDGVQGLAEQIRAASDERSCLTTQWARFALGAVALKAPDGCTNDLLELAASTKSVPELLIAITGTDAFRYRSPAP